MSGSSTSEQNKAGARVAFEVWSTGHRQKLDGFVATDVVHHDPYDRHGADGLHCIKTSIARSRDQNPDLQIVVHDQIAEGDKVATRWTGDHHPRRQAGHAGRHHDRQVRERPDRASVAHHRHARPAPADPGTTRGLTQGFPHPAPHGAVHRTAVRGARPVVGDARPPRRLVG